MDHSQWYHHWVTEMTARPQFQATTERTSDIFYIFYFTDKEKKRVLVVVFTKSAASQGNKLKFQST